MGRVFCPDRIAHFPSNPLNVSKAASELPSAAEAASIRKSTKPTLRKIIRNSFTPSSGIYAESRPCFDRITDYSEVDDHAFQLPVRRPIGGYIGNPIKMTFGEKLRGHEQCSPRR